MTTETITVATAEEEGGEESLAGRLRIDAPASVPLSAFAPAQPSGGRDPRHAKFSPRVAEWFTNHRLTEPHKRIAIAFAENLEKHSHASSASAGAKSKSQTKSDGAAKEPTPPEIDDPASCAHPLDDLLSVLYMSSYDVGTGESMTNLICSRLLEADHEVIIVTGFLDPSSTSTRTLCYTIEALATRQRLKNVRRGTDTTLKVHVCFSSSSFLQKITHTRSPRGRRWKPKEWRKLGLPGETYLAGAVELTVTSLFFRPVGLLHGKYAIVDRKTLLVPSSNVSWEEWLEGTATYTSWADDTGRDFVALVVRYWESVWRVGEESGPDEFSQLVDRFPVRVHEGGGGVIMDKNKGTAVDPMVWSSPAPAVFLPHPYQRSFPPVWPLGEVGAVWKVVRGLTGLVYTRAPENEATYLGNPQNAFIMAAIDGAQDSIYLHTPNVTARPIIDALVRAVKRGVLVEIVTSMNMMKWEQLVTAGTTTEKCLRKMVLEVGRFRDATPEGAVTTGGLFIYQFNPTRRPPLPPFVKSPEDNHSLTWYNKSHVKCLIVDEAVAVLGSGNADRASWVTSQEINVGLFLEIEKTRLLRRALVDALAGRVDVFKGSTWVRGGDGDEDLGYGVDCAPRKRRSDPEA
ncbi:hypothetical protein DRE_00175 [Drechslerella stenobrocha 248]|uniref:PLD phosphodiesterase domain-containing protein n=1 Tax=Drechslerella stenobrocha 248 TaxID=1043628 RepID=W7IHV5_9PEZI|nr:hypothetical protein DRE_00175 [Drechslerella stenobrocha 248]